MTIQIYVGTFAKYNAGSIGGAWVALEGHDEDSFAEACAELHKDEEGPEFMFQDFEGFPKSFYGECSIDSRVWEWVELDEDDREMWEAYIEGVDSSADFAKAQESFYGKYDSDTDLAYDFSSYNGFYFNNH